MKTYYCQRLFEDLNFSVEKVYICAGMTSSEGINIPDKNENIDDYINKLIKWRKKIFNKAIWGIIPDSCKKCVDLQKNSIPFIDYIQNLKTIKKYKIKKIVVKSFRQCEYSCVYCIEHKYTNGKQIEIPIKSNYYDILPIIQSLIKNKQIDHDVTVEFQGGSVSVLEEFEDVLDEVVKFGVSNLVYHLNGYKYIPKIVEYSKTIPTSISISIDSGTKETYLKIKHKDSFDQVIENIIKYASSNIEVNIKYIITRKYNDNIEEIKSFCNIVKYIKDNRISEMNNVVLMLDYDYRESLKLGRYFKLYGKYLELFLYAYEFCKNNDIDFSCNGYLKKLMKQQANVDIE